jgi:hypothetical protein
MTSQEIYDEIQKHWELFESNNARFQRTGLKAPGARARKAINHIRKLAVDYRTTCLSESKRERQ